MAFRPTPISLLVMVIAAGACSLPEADLRPNGWGREIYLERDSMRVELRNPIASPSHYALSSQIPEVDSLLGSGRAGLLAPFETLKVKFSLNGIDTSSVRASIRTTMSFAGIGTDSSETEFSLPFPRHRWYRVIQGYGGGFSHQSDFSRHAIDFALAVGDTVTAAGDGIVVGVIDGYDVGGPKEKYRPYANYVTLYHPESGLYTQYVHLDYRGSLVAVGETVSRYQPIGISGLTGFTDRPHLHFNVLTADSGGIVGSHPVFFEGGVDGAEFKRNTRAQHK